MTLSCSHMEDMGDLYFDARLNGIKVMTKTQEHLLFLLLILPPNSETQKLPTIAEVEFGDELIVFGNGVVDAQIEI